MSTSDSYYLPAYTMESKRGHLSPTDPSSVYNVDNFMISRRVAWLHRKLYARLLQEINESEQTPRMMQMNDEWNSALASRSPQTADNDSQKWFLAQIKGTLQPFSEFSQKIKNAGYIMLTTVHQIHSF